MRPRAALNRRISYSGCPAWRAEQSCQKCVENQHHDQPFDRSEVCRMANDDSDKREEKRHQENYSEREDAAHRGPILRSSSSVPLRLQGNDPVPPARRTDPARPHRRTDVDAVASHGQRHVRCSSMAGIARWRAVRCASGSTHNSGLAWRRSYSPKRAPLGSTILVTRPHRWSVTGPSNVTPLSRSSSIVVSMSSHIR